MPAESNSIITKYRPKRFEDVVGQAAVVRSLEKVVAERTATAFLFTGPPGTGKTTLSRILANKFGCHGADLQEEDAATQTGIENVRNIIEGLLYKPLGGGAKGIIIDEAQALSKAAFQALLKSLEDPPPWVYWFLCTTEPTKIPKAIQTRCATYQLKPVRDDDLFKILEDTQEADGIPDDILDICVREAEGSPRQALSNLGVVRAARSKAEAAELLRSAVESPQAFELARLLMQGAKWQQVCELIAKLPENTAAESVRHIIRSYMTKVALTSKSKGDVEHALSVLDAVSQPFNSFDGMSPLVLSLGKLILLR